MSYKFFLITILAFLFLPFCSNYKNQDLVEILGREEVDKLMQLSLDDFDQSTISFRKYSNCQITSKLIPAYIQLNQLNAAKSRNLHWHLGQIHVINDNYEDAIKEMKQSVEASKTWECYVDGTIAFLEKDRETPMEAYNTLAKQENSMNIEFLVNFLDNFDLSYS